MAKRTMRKTLISLLRLPKPQTPKNHPPLFRHFTADPSPPGSSGLPPSSESSSTVTQIVSILQTDENWRANDELRRLLFTTNRSTLSLSPSSLHKITLNLGTAEKGLNFFNFLRSNSPSPSLDPSSLAASLQAIFELAASEQRFLVDNLSQLYATYKEYNVPLTSYSAHLLIRCFAGAGQVKKSLSLYREFDPSLRNAQVSTFLLHVLLQSGRVEDAYQLLDEMPNPPNDSTVDIVMRAILWGKETGVSVSDNDIIGLVSKLGELGVFPTAVRLTQLINKLCKSRKLELAWDILHNVMNLGGDVQAPSCNALLTALSRYQHFDKMNQLMAHMKEKGIQPNVVTFGIIINRLCKGCRIDEALEVLEKMAGEGEIDVKPDTIVYNTVIDGLCKVGREEEGLALMEKMRLQQGCQPNTATYNCLIDGFCKAGEMEKARKLFDEMNEDGLHPNVITLNTMVDGMCKHGKFASAMGLVREMQKKGLEANATTYCSLIYAFCNANNFDRAMQLFDEMPKGKSSKDPTLYYTLIAGLSKAGRMEDASFIASSMKESGFMLDITCYNILIGGLCRKKRLDKAYDLLNEMGDAGLKPNVVTYNTLITHFSKSGDFATAHSFMKKMTSEGHLPTVVTYGALIHSYCLTGMIDEAMEIFKDMKVPPNTVIYNILINSYRRSNEVEVALSLMDDMNGKGVKPNTNTYNTLLRGLRGLEKALELMDQMTGHGCNPNYMSNSLRAAAASLRLAANTARSYHTIQAIPREYSGSRVAGRDRARGRIPAVVFSQDYIQKVHRGGGSVTSTRPTSRKLLLTTEKKQIQAIIKTVELPFFCSTKFLLQIHAGSGSSVVLESGNVLPIKIQTDKETGDILNLVFVWADDGTELKVDVPVVLRGEDECPGLKKGGHLNLVRPTLKYLCRAEHIPQKMEVDVSKLDIGGKVYMSEANFDPVLKLLSKDHNIPICHIVTTRPTGGFLTALRVSDVTCSNPYSTEHS